MIKGFRPLSSLLTQYLSHRDVLTANMTRFGSGFILNSHLTEAKEELDKIRDLLQEFELRKDEPKPKIILGGMGGCGGGGCFRK